MAPAGLPVPAQPSIARTGVQRGPLRSWSVISGASKLVLRDLALPTVEDRPLRAAVHSEPTAPAPRRKDRRFFERRERPGRARRRPALGRDRPPSKGAVLLRLGIDRGRLGPRTSVGMSWSPLKLCSRRPAPPAARWQ